MCDCHCDDYYDFVVDNEPLAVEPSADALRFWEYPPLVAKQPSITDVLTCTVRHSFSLDEWRKLYA